MATIQPNVTQVLVIGGGVVGLTILRTLTCDVKIKGVVLVEGEVRFDKIGRVKKQGGGVVCN